MTAGRFGGAFWSDEEALELDPVTAAQPWEHSGTLVLETNRSGRMFENQIVFSQVSA